MKFLEVFQKNDNELRLVGIPIESGKKIGSIEIEDSHVKSFIRLFSNEVYYSLIEAPDLIANINKGIYDSESREILGNVESLEEA